MEKEFDPMEAYKKHEEDEMCRKEERMDKFKRRLYDVIPENSIQDVMIKAIMDVVYEEFYKVV